MHYLLIDNSNTRTKFMLGSKNELLPWIARINTSEITHETIAEALQCQQWDAVYLCSVVPEKAQVIESSLADISDKPFKKLTYKSKLGMGIDYPNPEQIGADRLANGIAASTLYPSPCIIIDFGTAVTFDVISNGSYQGGVIAPGLGAMTDYLANKTALLPKISLREPNSAIGKSTEKAMDIGAVYGYRGLVRPDLIHHTHPTITNEGIRLAAILNF